MTEMTWKVLYDDNTSLDQFDKDSNKENSFNSINHDKLFAFCLLANQKIINIFMPTGTFGINGFLYDTDISRLPGQEYKLIYFVRRKKHMGTGGYVPADENTFFIGFQTIISGKSMKRMIAINGDTFRFVEE